MRREWAVAIIEEMLRMDADPNDTRAGIFSPNEISALKAAMEALTNGRT